MTSSLEYALLGLLKQSPQSGYDLRKLFASTPVRHFSDSPGSIYPALRRLQARKWLAGSAEKNNARKRQVFRITRAGEHALIEWLGRPITREDVIWRGAELILRFAFLDGNVERAVTAAFLNQFERELSTYTRELHEYARSAQSNSGPNTGWLAFQNGIEGYEAQIAWVRRARKQLMEDSHENR
jgi:DNA-binding PadR family transcriptional regulator